MSANAFRSLPPPPAEGPTRGIPGFDAEQHAAMLAALADLRYPVGPKGETLTLMEVFTPIVAYHLVRCGWRPDMTKRKVKARKVYGTGVYEDAVHWVSIHEPDDPLANVREMTMAEIDALPDELRAEARRRLGFPTEAPPPPPEWHTTTRINITDAEEPPDEP